MANLNPDSIGSPTRKKVKFGHKVKYECISCGTGIFSNNDLLDAHQMGIVNSNSSTSLGSVN